MNIENQKLFYEEYWGKNQYLNSLKLRRGIKILEFSVIVKKKFGKPSILDLGSGDGRLTSFLGQFGQTDAIELSQQAVDRANKLYPHVKYQQGNALDFNFNNKTYDTVISQEVLEHIEEKTNYIRVCHNVLKLGGYLIITTPNKNVIDNMKRGEEWSNQPIELPLTKSELIKLLIDNHFKILNYESIIMNFGDKGFYKIVNHVYIISVFKHLGISKLRERILSKYGFGLHHCILAQKQT